MRRAIPSFPVGYYVVGDWIFGEFIFAQLSESKLQDNGRLGVSLILCEIHSEYGVRKDYLRLRNLEGFNLIRVPLLKSMYSM